VSLPNQNLIGYERFQPSGKFERKESDELARITAADVYRDTSVARIATGKPAIPFLPRFGDQASVVSFYGVQHRLRDLARELVIRSVTIVQAGHCGPFNAAGNTPDRLGSALKLLQLRAILGSTNGYAYPPGR
jgi:hypothetical protein